jgi:ABC-2 type transport system ATP-binding protein
MDEAARCHRVGFMRAGRLLVEGAPEQLRSRLNNRIVEVRGRPLPLLRDVARADADVEDAQMFGDRLHLRVSQGAVTRALDSLMERLLAAGGEVSVLRAIPPTLEDVFISLLEDKDG